ncbi:McrB family protein [Cupriavidus pinatubonensis]|uniref:ATPase associated with various cellular activities, AAA_5 n=1 Tax=Cupriavidus pinatubonensis TaxID=248026 RepID=A0ABN7ZG63_9BURK|nr:hypothetical protein [Cupriavidus pinatubonensis]CAG9183256.1 hypothetical protein LMG23994_05099 [Cupriavidus pinatubonensis]
MPKFLAAGRLKASVDALSDTRAKGALMDFLVVKRTLALKGGTTVPLATGEPAFVRATCELASVHNNPRPSAASEKEYFVPFTVGTDKGGFRKGKWLSNGTGSTIGGTTWANVIGVSTDSPRRAGLVPGYEGHLADLMLKEASRSTSKPSLGELAIWTHRHADIESVIGTESDPIKRGELLQNRLISDLALSPGEISVLFDTPACAIADQDIVPTVADPVEYLAGLLPPTTAATAPAGVDCPLDLVTALAAKPFVILSGASGTGKSRSTLRLAEALQSQYAGSVSGQIFQLVPIGPDWTSPKKLLGYRTPFGRARKGADGSDTNESYEITETLRIILRACHKDSTKVPHFLVFDEMNLSHVERYFAPFLSLMEASSILDDGENAPIVDRQALSVISEILDAEDKESPEAESARLLVERDQPLTLPPNLFYVGTVNVDETTYMFSPKVLDRAHVLEVQAQPPSEYVAGTGAGRTIDLVQANDLLRSAIDDREVRASNSADPTAVVDLLATKHGIDPTELASAKRLTLKALDGCFHLLKPTGFEFGFRVVKEVHDYLHVWIKAQLAMGTSPTDAMKSWTSGLDRALFQKVLPKIHGNRSVLGDGLKALAAFLDGYHADNDPAAQFTLGIDEDIRIEPSDVLGVSPGSFPISTTKLRNMHGRLISRNYTSFIR